MAKLTAKEFETKVIDLAKKGLTTEKIGLELKKEKIYAKDYIKLSKILKANKLFTSSDIASLTKRVEKLQKHALKHKQDKCHKRAIAIKGSKLRKLTKVTKI